MSAGWLSFRRKASFNHTLEAKIAVGGESYGHPDMKLKAEAGQWICRNPKNGHCWIMSDEGMHQFYDPFDRENEHWKTLIGRLELQNKKKSKGKKTTQKKKVFFGHENDPSLF